MKNSHLVPAAVHDIIEKLQQKDLRANEQMNYVLRLEAIRDFCDQALKKTSQKNIFDDMHKRKAGTGKARS